MIGYLEGEVKKVSGTKIIISCNGVGYEVYWIGKTLVVGDRIEAWVHTHMTEKSTALYGFEDERSKVTFLSLLKVSGVGPKSAYSIVATLGSKATSEAILAGSVDAISAAPGVGKKLAKRILTELKDDFSLSDEESPIFSEAEQALVDLGYRAAQVRKALLEAGKEKSDWKLEELIKEILKRLQK